MFKWGLLLLHLFLEIFETEKKLKVIVGKESCVGFCGLESWRSLEIRI